MEMQDFPLGSGTPQHQRAPLAGGVVTQVGKVTTATR